MMNLMLGDCLERMREIPDGSVDMILCDLPYGTTRCYWDSVIPFAPLWAEYKRIAKPNAAIVLTGSQPFTSALIMSNLKMFKYCWVWEKSKASMFHHAKNSPMRKHEDIAVFSDGVIGHKSQTKRRMPYEPQGISTLNRFQTPRSKRDDAHKQQRVSDTVGYMQTATNYPCSILKFDSVHNPPHPTQKPVALMEYLIKTYTNEGETVLDNCMGSGTTGVACVTTGRKFIGIEQDAGYFAIAQERIQKAVKASQEVIAP